jgi:hypothetical protein
MIDPKKDNTEKLSELKAVYKLAIETRNFEIHQLINRNNFFMLFQGVLLAAVFNNQASKPFGCAVKNSTLLPLNWMHDGSRR